MKRRLWSWTAVLVAVACLTGCGNDKDASADRVKAEREIPLNRLRVEKFVTLGDYSNLMVAVDPIKVDEEELNTLLNNVYLSSVDTEQFGITDRTVAVGDTVIIDYEGKKDGIAFEGGTALGANLTIGSGQFIDGFEDGLVGVMPGETVDLDLTFPESYGNADLAGQQVVFTVTVHYILPTEIAPEDMEDDVVASMGIENVSKVEELRQYVYDYLYSNAETNYTYNLKNGIMDALMEQCMFGELPEKLVDSYRAIIRESIESNAAAYEVDAETYAYYFFGMTSDEVVETYAEETLRQDMVLQAIANAEGLRISDEKLQEKLLEYAQEAGYGTVEEYMGNNSPEDYRNYFMNETVMEYLNEKATITENQ